MINILLTGIATLDIINHVDHYPIEDSEIRASEQHKRTGGNASNSSIVLQQLGINAYLLANRADDSNAQAIFTELNNQQVNTSLCTIQKHSTTPTSYITLNLQNGSRSIIHYRDLLELQSQDFTCLQLDNFDWFHFEARECLQLESMLLHAQSYRKPISLEVEKARDHIDSIMPLANILLFSRPFAKARGFSCAIDCLKYFAGIYPDKIMTCTWGELGAWSCVNSDIFHYCPTILPQPIDTLGAGDTFNAGFISQIIKHNDVPRALTFACQLAANKCQQTGFSQIIIPH